MVCTKKEWKEFKQKELVGKVDYLFKKVCSVEERLKKLEGGK